MKKSLLDFELPQLKIMEQEAHRMYEDCSDEEQEYYYNRIVEVEKAIEAKVDQNFKSVGL